MRYRVWILVWVLALIACDDSMPVGADMMGLDGIDQGTVDPDQTLPDQQIFDLGRPDLAILDLAVPDQGIADAVSPDMVLDMSSHDLGALDMARPDMAPDMGDPCALQPEIQMGRWALSIFYFNLQAVPGGLEGYAEATGDQAQAELSAEEIEDRIITQSLEPMLALLEGSPNFALTFAMSGVMIDVIHARHPEVLGRMQQLITDHQLEVVSVLWSGQFFLGYGKRETEINVAMAEASFERAMLPLSTVSFTPAGQFGDGYAEWITGARPGVTVMPAALFRFFQHEAGSQPWWSIGEAQVVIPEAVDTDKLQVEWTYFGQGETFATGGTTPRMGDAYQTDLDAVSAYKSQLDCRVAQGYQIALISDYAETLSEGMVVPTPMPSIMDGTWQPNETPRRWLGGGGNFVRHEADNQVATACMRARRPLLALDTLVTVGQPGADAEILAVAWAELLLGQVALGPNPWLGEVRYGIRHCEAAEILASDALDAVLLPVGILRVDPLLQLAEPVPGQPGVRGLPAEAPIQVDVVEAGGREVTLTWNRVGDNLELTIDWAPNLDALAAYEACIADDGAEASCLRDPPPLAIQIPRTPGHIGYWSALARGPRVYQEADFDLSPNGLANGIWLAAGNGFVGLGEDQYFIKNTELVHLAAGFLPGDVVEFRDETQPSHLGARWVFTYTNNLGRAVGVASRNMNPVTYIER